MSRRPRGADAIPIFVVPDPFDAAAVAELRPRFDRIAESGSGDLILDFSNVDFVDSSGVGVVVFLYKRLAARGARLIVVGLRGHPRKLFELLHVDRVIETYDSLDDIDSEPVTARTTTVTP